MGDKLAMLPRGTADKATSSLVLQQCLLALKRAIIAAMHATLKPGGGLFVADFGEQRTLLMRLLFRPIQCLDGYENIQPNAQGVLPKLFTQAGFQNVAEREVVLTPTGLIFVHSCRSV